MSDIDTLLAEYRAVAASGRVYRAEEANTYLRRSEIARKLYDITESYAEVGRLIGLTRAGARLLALRATQ